MNIYAHAISAVRKSNGTRTMNTATCLAPSMEDSITSVYMQALSMWPSDQFHSHQVLTESSQQIPQQMIDAAASK